MDPADLILFTLTHEMIVLSQFLRKRNAFNALELFLKAMPGSLMNTINRVIFQYNNACDISTSFDLETESGVAK